MLVQSMTMAELRRLVKRVNEVHVYMPLFEGDKKGVYVQMTKKSMLLAMRGITGKTLVTSAVTLRESGQGKQYKRLYIN